MVPLEALRKHRKGLMRILLWEAPSNSVDGRPEAQVPNLALLLLAIEL